MLVDAVDVGLNVAVIPGGSPAVKERSTLREKPACGITVTVVDAELPGTTKTGFGLLAN